MSNERETSWTEQPHWSVMGREPYSEPWCIAHYEFRRDAVEHASRSRVHYGPGTDVWVGRVA